MQCMVVTQAGEAWDYPQPFDNVTPTDMRWMCEEVCHQKYRYDPLSPDWVGLALAKHLGLHDGHAEAGVRGATCGGCWRGRPSRAVDEARPYRPYFPLGAPDRD